MRDERLSERVAFFCFVANTRCYVANNRENVATFIKNVAYNREKIAG